MKQRPMRIKLPINLHNAKIDNLICFKSLDLVFFIGDEIPIHVVIPIHTIVMENFIQNRKLESKESGIMDHEHNPAPIIPITSSVEFILEVDWGAFRVNLKHKYLIRMKYDKIKEYVVMEMIKNIESATSMLIK